MGIYLIAEAGVNHNGNVARALEMIEAAAKAGADCIKFQTFVPEEVISRYAAKAEYQKSNTDPSEGMLDMVRAFRLDAAAHRTAIAHCRATGIDFLSTPYDQPSVDLLVQDLGLDRLKIPSGEITNLPLLLKAARTGCSIILSSGMSTLDEVGRALSVLAFGYLVPSARPSLDACREAFASDDGQRALHHRVTLLHCTTEYPASFEDVNLRAMDTLAANFSLPVGISDHTLGIAVPIAAAARGAAMIEKHFTLDRRLPGPDHQASLEPDELTDMVAGVRAVEKSLGDGIKRPAVSEQKNIAVARKYLVARQAIRMGQVFDDANVAIKRCGGGGVPADHYWDWLGRTATRDYGEDEALDP